MLWLFCLGPDADPSAAVCRHFVWANVIACLLVTVVIVGFMCVQSGVGVHPWSIIVV